MGSILVHISGYAESYLMAILSYEALGQIMLDTYGEEANLGGYGTTDPEWVGRAALEYGDIERDGTLT